MGRKVDSPRQGGSGHEHLNVFVSKEFFYKSSVDPVHASVVDGKPIGKEVLQLNVLIHTNK